MKRKIAKVLVLSLIAGMLLHADVFAATLDPSIPTSFGNLNLDTDGTASFTPPTYTATATVSGVSVEISQWKKFEAQLLRRTSTITSGTTTYNWTKTEGSVKSCDADEEEIEFTFPKVGYYQFKIRGVNLEGNYSAWVQISTATDYEGLPISEDDLSISHNSGTISGGSTTNTGGPGVVQTNNLPIGYQYAVVGPNGEILYNYANNSNYGQYYGTSGGALQYQQNSNQYLGPGYANNMQGGSQVLYPNTGISSYPQVESPYGYNIGAQNNQNNNYQYNPNYSNNASYQTNNYGGSPQITQALEVGWHVDGNGRFYYQGNGMVLKSTWYLIDGSYYRFGDNGYLMANQWFKDNNTGYWYFLAGDGRMLTGWQCLNGTWYYFKPQNGNGYGTMYANTSLYIEDKEWGNGYYAFDLNGAMVRNAWYGGYYYSNDGSRTN